MLYSINLLHNAESTGQTYKIINSTAFPKVTFVNAPIVSPMRLATHSVAWLNKPAKGTIATAFIAKMMVGLM